MSDFVDDEEVPELEEVEPVGEEKKEATEDTSLANSDVTTKYQEAAKIVNSTLVDLLAMCVAGTRVIDICKAGDGSIEQKAALIFRNKQKGKVIDKGIAFPVCVSVNECICHYSPLESDPEHYVLKDGDLVKIDLGCHVDGYISVAAHTTIVGYVPQPDAPIGGVKADVFAAAFAAADVACRLIRVGNTNTAVTEAMKRVAEAYGVQSIAGTLMHQMKRFVIDGNKMILLREEPDQKVEKCTFEAHEVYAIDIAMTSGEGKPREVDTRTTVFKRVVDKQYSLRIKGSRQFFNEVNKRFPTMPFSLRSFSDERNARMGVRECVAHELIVPYPVLYERPSDIIVHVKFTVLLMPNGAIKVTGLTLPEGIVSERALPEDLQALLAEVPKKKRNKKKKGGAKKADEAVEEEEA